MNIDVRKSLRAAGLAALFALIATGALRAQEEGGEAKPEDLFKSAKQAYDAKKYGSSMREVQQLLSELTKLRVDQLKTLLPAAPAEWTAKEASGADQGPMLMGLGVTVKREYRKGDSRVEATLLSDSPMVSSMAAMLTNPMLIQSNPNLSIVTIQGKKSLLEMAKDSKNVKLSVLLNGNTSLLTFEGQGVERKDVTETLCKAFDFAAIEKALQD